MNYIIDKLALLLLSGIAVFTIDGLTRPVLILLAAVILSELTHILPEKSAIVPVIAAGIAALFFPHMTMTFSIFIYDAIRLKRIPVLALHLIAFAAAVTSFSPISIAVIIISLFFCVLLYFRTSSTISLYKKLNEQRDDSEEMKLLLSEKNRSLMEKQDSEIYTATLKERNRIAREIHDNVGHSLTRSLLQIGALQILNKDENLTESIDSIKTTLNSAMTSIRKSVYDLHSTTVDLEKLMKECVSHLKERFNVKLDYCISENAHTNIKLCLLGITKEAVSNIIKHSSGDTVSISVREHPGFYQLVISDNGKNSGVIHNTGMGISSMRERAENAGGVFNVISSDNEFRIFATIPKSK